MTDPEPQTPPALAAEGTTTFRTRYFYASPPLHPVGFVAVGNAYDWAAYTAGMPTYSDPGPFWERVARDGNKLPEPVARAIFPDSDLAERNYRR